MLEKTFFSNPLPFSTGNLSANEVRNAISKLKTKKTPGPELFKWLDDHTLEQLTGCLNVFWTEKQVPDSFTEAQLCCIYKKGAHDNPENYRPISLLNTGYKIFASIIQSCLANILEPLLGDTQYGFRPKRSTAEPLFCVCRLADFAEQGNGNDPLFLIFLDWEKAFDKIDHEKMFNSLSRLKIPHSQTY